MPIYTVQNQFNQTCVNKYVNKVQHLWLWDFI